MQNLDRITIITEGTLAILKDMHLGSKSGLAFDVWLEEKYPNKTIIVSEALEI